MVYVFDIRDVVLYFDPRTFLRTLWKDEARAGRLYDAVFQSPEWRLMEEGSVTQEEAALWLCRRHPDDAEHIRMILKYWLRCLTPRWEIVELLLDMKAQGMRLYFLAGLSLTGRDYVLSTYPFFSVFDGGLFSCDTKKAEKDRSFYEDLCAAYRLPPEECVFVGGRRDVVAGAGAAGMREHLFVGAERLKDMILL